MQSIYSRFQELTAYTLAFLLAAAVAAGGAAAEELAGTAPASAPPAVGELAAPAAPAPAAPADLERRVDAIAADLERLKLGEAAAPAGLKSKYGLGPAASKVYGQTHGLSIGGYGEGLYRNTLGEPRKDMLDFVRNILYVGYKFDDRFVLNTEIEIEHADEIYMEFAYIDYLWRPEINLRAGMVLVPMGIVGELHEPTTLLTATRPETETAILPSTWRENGAGVFGDLGGFTYRGYVLAGLNAAGFNATGLRGGRQKGSETKADDLAGVVRLDWTGTPGLMVGGSVYYGASDQDQFGAADVTNLIYEGHVDFKWRGLDVRGLFARAHTDGAKELNSALKLAGAKGVGTLAQGFYGQVGYDVLAPIGIRDQSLSPFVRYERVDTHLAVVEGQPFDPKQDRTTVAMGAAYAPISQIVVKGEYQLRDGATQTVADKTKDQWFLQIGYIF